MAEASSRVDSKSKAAQSIPLLRTKLYIPPARPSPVPRPRLTQRLNEGLDRKLILISAPAGFGKTTLLSEWRATSPASETPFVWVAALEGIEPRLSEGAGLLFRSLQSPPAESALEMLINDLATIPEDFTLVLDDYHVITNEAIHQSLIFLIEHMPPQMHLVIASRTTPPLPLTLLRGRGQLAELRSDDLRFTPDEIAVFLNNVMGLNLSSEQIAALDERTEGWIVGLQMAAVSMQGKEDVSGLIAEFSGDDRYVLDYLIEQVLDRQMGQVQSFLLQTSILDRMCGSLCEAVTGQEDGQATLEALESANLFIIPLDNRRRWYRYHHLFAAVLQTRLQQTQPDLVPELHSRASGWYEDNGLMEEAVDHALAADDFETAASLMERAADSVARRRETGKLLMWLELLPEEVILSRPRLCLKYAYLLSWSGQHDVAGEWLQVVERALDVACRNTAKPSDDIQRMRVEAAGVRMFLASDYSRIAEIESRTLALLPEDDVLWRIHVNAYAGMAYWFAGSAGVGAFVEMEKKLAGVVPHIVADPRLRPLEFSNLNPRTAIEVLGWAREGRGHLHQAMDVYRQALHLATSEGDAAAIWAARAHDYIGRILYEWNDLDKAMHHCLRFIEIAKQLDTAWSQVSGYLGLAWIFKARGEMDGMNEAMQQAAQQMPRVTWGENPTNIAAVRALRAGLWLKQGNLEATSRWAEESGLTVDDETTTQNWVEDFWFAQLLITQGKADDMLRLLLRLQRRMEATGAINHMVWIKAQQALALQIQGNLEQATASLAQALSLAEQGGYVRTFVNNGEPMAKLLRQAASQGISPQYVAKLLSAFDRTTEPPLPVSQPLVEPLSERELEVLRLIAAGLSNREIADDLVVGVSTVKKHINNLYGKLGVHSRTQAIARVRDLGLET